MFDGFEVGGLLGKWAWRFRSEGSKGWVKIIKSIYGTLGGFEDPNVLAAQGAWREIVKAVKCIESVKTAVTHSNVLFGMGHPLNLGIMSGLIICPCILSIMKITLVRNGLGGVIQVARRLGSL